MYLSFNKNLKYQALNWSGFPVLSVMVLNVIVLHPNLKFQYCDNTALQGFALWLRLQLARNLRQILASLAEKIGASAPSRLYVRDPSERQRHRE